MKLNQADLNNLNTAFENKVRSSEKEAFEAFFTEVMQAVDPFFQPVKPKGNIGDEANDGFNMKTGTYYQCYAPENLKKDKTIKDAATKMEHDFKRLYEKWNALCTVKKWFFVINDKFAGADPEITKKALELNEANPDTEIQLFLTASLKELFMKLPVEEQCRILDFTPGGSEEQRSPALQSNFSKNTDKIIGREKFLERIEQYLSEQGNQGENRRLYIRGFGGIGKSVLAKEYAQRHKSEYNLIFEVSTESFKGMVEEILMDVPDDMSYPNKLNILRELLHTTRALIIVHDYNVENDETEQWDSLSCDLLITTWNDKKEKGKQIYLRNSDLDLADAVNIFVSYYAVSDDEDLREELLSNIEKEKDAVEALVRKVDYHPLTIKLLAKQMTCHENDILTPEKMLGELNIQGIREHAGMKFLNKHVSGDASKTLNTDAMGHLADIYAAAVRRNNLSAEMKEALSYMTLVGPVNGISSRRFEKWTGLSSSLLNQMEKNGWIYFDRKHEDLLDMEEDRKKGTFHMPMVIGETLYQVEELKRTCESSKIFLNALYDIKKDCMIGYPPRSAVLEQYMVIAEHLGETEDELYGKLIHEAGYYVWQLKNTKELWLLSLKYMEKALEIRKSVLGENHADTATSYNNVGISYEEMGDRQKGLEYQEKALEIRRRVLGENHADTADSYNNVGYTYEEMGDRQKGLEYQEKALEIRRHVLGENHADTAQSYNNVGCSYWGMGDRQKGLEYQEKALEIRRRVLGENHANTATSYNNVGISYWEMGDHQKGLEYQEKALEIRRCVLGENHPNTVVSRNNVEYMRKMMG